MECRTICCFLLLPLLLLLLLFLLRTLIKDVGVKIKIFEPYISVCILVKAMKHLVLALQPYITLFKLQLALETPIRRLFKS